MTRSQTCWAIVHPLGPQKGLREKKFVRQALCLKGPLPSGLLGIMRGFVALQSELSSDAIMGRRFFFWTGNIREVLVTLVLAFAILQGSGWSSNWLSIFGDQREKKHSRPRPKVEDQVGCFFGWPGPGVSKGNLIDLPASKEADESKQSFSIG